MGLVLTDVWWWRWGTSLGNLPFLHKIKKGELQSLSSEQRKFYKFWTSFGVNNLNSFNNGGVPIWPIWRWNLSLRGQQTLWVNEPGVVQCSQCSNIGNSADAFAEHWRTYCHCIQQRTGQMPKYGALEWPVDGAYNFYPSNTSYHAIFYPARTPVLRWMVCHLHTDA
jgi:hypothetical protein